GATGTWLAYTIHVAEAGEYTFALRAETSTGGAYHVVVDGTSLFGAVPIPALGAWDTASSWHTVAAPGSYPLSAGQHLLKIFVDASWVDMNALIVQAASSSTGSPVNGSCGPANGVSVASAPSVNLCSSGSAASVTGTGPWSWTCAGINGGTTASCSAP